MFLIRYFAVDVCEHEEHVERKGELISINVYVGFYATINLEN